ncbi:MAG: hypothetical protein KKH52_00795, partial [Nanoarchaeota archaeon]|nr:hypothetical protein [Nanoarchaeota archaeon]
MKRKITRKGPSVPQHNVEKGKPWLILGISFIILITFIAIFASFRSGPGRAIYIGETPFLEGTIDLTKEESVTFTFPATTATKNISINTSLETYDENPQLYEFNFTQLDIYTYTFDIFDKDRIKLAQDILSNYGDITLIHLNLDDPFADLEVSLANGKITVKNLHYLSSDYSFINFTNSSNQPYPLIIRLNKSQSINGTIRATSTSPPLITTNLGTLDLAEEHLEDN